MIPQENEKDLADIPDNVKKRGLEIIATDSVDEVLKHTLVEEPAPYRVERCRKRWSRFPSEQGSDEASAAVW